MTARDDILAAVRNNAPPSRELPTVGDFRRDPDDLVALFATALARLDGKAIVPPAAGVAGWLAETFPTAARVCSGTDEVSGSVAPRGFADWAAPADVDVTVVRTPLGVAETGSILLTEHVLPVTTAAVLARHLVVLLDPADIVENVHQAYRHPAFREAAYSVLLSGPSGSADIGGKTVHPAQGVTTLTAILAPRPSG